MTVQSLIGKYFHFDEGFRRYFWHTSWNLIGKIFSLISGLVVTVVVIRYLGPENNGKLVYAATIVNLISFAASLGIDSLLYRDLISRPDDRDKLLGTAFVVKSAGAFISLAILLLVLFFLRNDPFMNILILFNAAPLLFNGFNVINYFFQAKVLSKVITINYLAVTCVILSSKLLFVWLGKGLLWFAALVLFETILITLGYIIVYKRAKLNLRCWSFDRPLAFNLLKYSWPLILSTAFTIIYSRIDQVMIRHMLGLASVGVYDVAVRLSEVWYFFPAIIVGSLFPAIMNSKKHSETMYHQRLSRLYSLIIAISFIVIIPISLFSKLIISLLFGTAFAAAAPVLSIYAWSGLSIAMATVVNQYLLAENYVRILFFLNLISMLANVILNIWLIPKYGIVGAAYATLISYWLSVLGVIFFKKTRNHVGLIFKSLFFKY